MFKQWSRHSNVYVAGVEDFDLTPFMAVSDLMISDESSAIFEFTALNKPVILNRFLKLRLSYYLFPDKLKKRMDSGMDSYRNIGPNPDTYKEMVAFAREELDNPQRYEEIRKKYAAALTGNTDGKVSERIVDFMQEHLLNK